MKTFVIKLAQAAMLLCAQTILGQQFYGKAVYETKMRPPSMEVSGSTMSPEMQKMIEAQLKSQLEKTFLLTFNQTESNWEEEQKLDTPQPNMPGVNVKIVNSGDGRRYTSLKDKTSISEQEIMGKEFVVSEKLPAWEWKITDESKKIGNYTCYKATAIVKVTDEERAEYERNKAEMAQNPKRVIIIDEPQDYEITAWFTPDIPVGHGPENFYGLPGLILETNDGQRVTLCSKIILNPKEKPTVFVPKNGEKVTMEQFEKIREKKMKEMQDMPQGRGERQVIRIGG